MIREVKYRGKSLEELKPMSDEEFAKLVGSRARRTLKNGVNKMINKRIAKMLTRPPKTREGPVVKTHCRDAIVTPRMVGLNIGVYSGKEFVPVIITMEMLGHYLGEFSLTRKRLRHGKAGIGATRSSTAITAR